MQKDNQYLYRFTHTHQFYFSMRYPSAVRRLFLLASPHFRVTLNTSEPSEANFLASFIKTRLHSDMEKWTTMDARARESLIAQIQAKAAKEEKKWNFVQHLRQRFDLYLNWEKNIG